MSESARSRKSSSGATQEASTAEHGVSIPEFARVRPRPSLTRATQPPVDGGESKRPTLSRSLPRPPRRQTDPQCRSLRTRLQLPSDSTNSLASQEHPFRSGQPRRSRRYRSLASCLQPGRRCLPSQSAKAVSAAAVARQRPQSLWSETMRRLETPTRWYLLPLPKKHPAREPRPRLPFQALPPPAPLSSSPAAVAADLRSERDQRCYQHSAIRRQCLASALGPLSWLSRNPGWYPSLLWSAL